MLLKEIQEGLEDEEEDVSICWPYGGEKILEIDRGSIGSGFFFNSLCKGLWSSRKTD